MIPSSSQVCPGAVLMCGGWSMARIVRLSLAGIAGGLFLAHGMAWAEAPAGVTFTHDVAPILYKNCVSCHRTGEVGPMALTSYKEVRPWAKSIREVVVSHTMPPWGADPKHTEFANDRRLSDKDVS